MRFISAILNRLLKQQQNKVLCAFVIAIFLPSLILAGCSFLPQTKEEQGGPISGLTLYQTIQFYQYKKLFTKTFEIQSGLGPLFNAKSCFACHGSPGIVGGAGTNLKETSCLRVARRLSGSVSYKEPYDKAIQDVYPIDMDYLETFGGSLLARKSITQEFPKEFPPRVSIRGATIPDKCIAEFVSTRQPNPLFGLGLLGAIPDQTIDEIRKQQHKSHPNIIGRMPGGINYFGEQLTYGRFGWKAQHTSLLSFTLEALNFEMGITTPAYPLSKTATYPGNVPANLQKLLPKDPNNNGELGLKLAYFISLLAPPPEHYLKSAEEIKGEAVFDKTGCTACHIPTLKTADKVFIADPEAQFPDISRLTKEYGEFWYEHNKAKVKLIELQALEKRVIHPYTDLLIHKMGHPLADGIPQGSAGGDYWRTTPLWGLHLRHYYLHDGRTTNLSEAILAHDGQAKESVEAYKALSDNDRNCLLMFLKSL